MTLEVKCRSCWKPVETDEGLTCRACRMIIKTPFQMKMPSFTELQHPDRQKSNSRNLVWTFAAITVLLPLLMTATYWLAKHFFH